MLNELEKKIIDISYRHKLSHISSCLNTVNVIDEIYAKRQPHEPFVLGNSHAALALFVVLEKHGLCDAEEMVQTHGTHAARDMEHGVWVSGGSLGQAETVAVGLALSDRNRRVYVVTSDGACSEGSIYEMLRFWFHNKLNNLEVHCICNSLGAYGPAWPQLGMIVHEVGEKLPALLKGLQGHYRQLSKEQYEQLCRE